jgi:hypothetical protein
MLILSTHAATTINNANSFSYGANIGWMNWRGDTNNGAVIGEFVCSGFIWGANVGWINLGDGTPPNGIYYQNNSASDFGVNHDGLGNLRGFAWGANIGWLNFTNQSATGATYEGPKVDLLTGRLGGFVWSPNCGWISLSNAIAFVQTDFIHMGADSDADGITDAWETFYFNNLTTATAASDADGDGFSDVREYRADTNPTNAASHLRITRFSASEGGTNVSLTWSSMASRLYRIRETNDVAAPNPWADVGLGLFAPDAGATTTRTFTDTASPQRFFEIEAVRPLSP